MNANQSSDQNSESSDAENVVVREKKDNHNTVYPRVLTTTYEVHITFWAVIASWDVPSLYIEADSEALLVSNKADLRS